MPIGPRNDELKKMRKIKLTDILLLSVSGLLDIFQEIKDPLGIYSKYYENFYGFVPDRWKRQNYYALVSRLLKDKRIEKIGKKSQTKYKITSKGLIHLQDKQLLLNNQKKKWDKKWRILIFDIEETNRYKRRLLRYKLKELGFGYFQRSVWISPYDVSENLEKFLDIYNLKDKAVLIESSKLSMPNKKIASIVWPINKIKLLYEEIYKKLYRLFKLVKSNKDKHELKLNFNEIYNQLVSVILHDPHLPKDFLPVDWQYSKTVELAKKLRSIFLNQN